MFEILEHTADIGLRAEGATAEEAFASAAEGLVAIAMEVENIQSAETRIVSAAGDDWESLAVNFLNEVLYTLDAARFAACRFEITRIEESADGFRIEARAWGEPRDPVRHRPRLVVKGVTWHQLKVSPTPGRWTIEVFLDI